MVSESPSVTSRPPATRRAVGRPRLVTQEQVIEAALRLGPQPLTMTRVAEELGVSPATLYLYVTDRDHLVRLVTARRLGDLAIPDDVGQDWTDFLREYVHILTGKLSTNTSDLLQVLAVGSTLEVELRLAERFYEIMSARGFSIDESVEIMTQASVIAIGAAMGICRDRLAAEATGSMAGALSDVLATVPSDDLPLVRRAVPAYETRGAGVDGELVEGLIARIALRRRRPVDREGPPGHQAPPHTPTIGGMTP
jgi:AcrR family transcriptional regulator